MGTKYTQLTLSERCELKSLRYAGHSIRQIGLLMGRSHSTISRELRRNGLRDGVYKPERAEIMYQVRRDRLCKLQRTGTLRDYVHDRLTMGWSPEQIAGRLTLEHSSETISHETIYRYIYRTDMRQERLWRYLSYAKSKRGLHYFKRKREPVVQDMAIAKRPQAIEL